MQAKCRSGSCAKVLGPAMTRQGVVGPGENPAVPVSGAREGPPETSSRRAECPRTGMAANLLTSGHPRSHSWLSGYLWEGLPEAQAAPGPCANITC